MLEYVYGHDQEIAQFVAQRIPHCRRGFGPNVAAIGVIDETGRLLFGVVYHNWDPEAGIIEMSGAAIGTQQWLSRETLKRIYRYPFQVCGCQLTVMRVPADNEALLYVLSRFGYSFIAFPRLFGRERDGVVCTLSREDWEANKFCQRFGHHLPDLLPAMTHHEAA